MKRLQRLAWILVLVVDVSYIAWGGMAAAWPNHLLGPHGTPILTAGYEGFTKSSWSELTRTAPTTAAYIEMVFRLYGLYCAVFGLITSAIAATAFRRGERWAWWTLLAGNVLALVSAMTYDWTVNAIGPFEVTEYLGLATILGALAITARGQGGSAHFELHAHLKIRPGQLEGFKAQAAELIRITREQDTKTLRYDWFINEDGTECEVHEAYVNEQGLFEHNRHVMDARAVLFGQYAFDHRMIAFGEVSQQFRELTKKHAEGFSIYGFVEGLGPTAAV